MKPLFFAIVWGCLFSTGYAQSEFNDSSKSTLSFDVGWAYRITPIYTQGPDGSFLASSPLVYWSSHKNLTGFNLNFGLRFKFWKRFFVGVRYGVRYDHIGYQGFNFSAQPSGSRPDIKSFLSEFQGDIGMVYYKKDGLEAFFSLGASQLNIGSDFSTYRTEVINGIDTFYVISEQGFRFFTNDLTLGLKKDRIGFEVNMYFSSPSTIDFYDKTPFIVPELRFRYYISENLL